MIELVGYLASAGAMAMWLPQVVRTLRHRGDRAYLHVVSATAYGTAIVFNALLIAYGLLSQSVPVAAAGCVNLLCAIVIVAVKVAA